MPEENDPLTQIYDGIWKLVEDFQLFADTVRVGNRISLADSSRYPYKESVSTKDLPEVILHPSGGQCFLHDDSDTSRFVRYFQFLISTGDMRVDHLHFPLQWHVIRAISDWKSSIGGLTWKEHPFLYNMDIPDTTEGESDPERNRNIEGWSSIVQIRADFEIATNLLRM